MKKLLLFTLLVLVLTVNAQDEPEIFSDIPDAAESTWSHSLKVSAGLNQAYFENWAAGGESTLSWSAGLEGKLDYEPGGFFWNSELGLAYGQTKIGDDDFRKAVDGIKLSTRGGYELDPLARLYAEATLGTQFDIGYDYEPDPKVGVSNFADPLLMTQSAGVESRWMDWWTTRLAFGVKETFTTTYTAWSDDPDTTEVESSKIEGGIFFASIWTLTWDEVFTFDSKLGLFSPFTDRLAHRLARAEAHRGNALRKGHHRQTPALPDRRTLCDFLAVTTEVEDVLRRTADLSGSALFNS